MSGEENRNNSRCGLYVDVARSAMSAYREPAMNHYRGAAPASRVTASQALRELEERLETLERQVARLIRRRDEAAGAAVPPAPGRSAVSPGRAGFSAGRPCQY